IENDAEKAPVSKHRTLLLRLCKRIRRDFRGERDEVVGEIQAAGDRADDRHDDVSNQRIDNRAERSADNDADREVDDVAAHREFLEFLEHSAAPARRPDERAKSELSTRSLTQRFAGPTVRRASALT